MKNNLKKNNELSPDTITACVANADSTNQTFSAKKRWLCEKEFKIEN